MSNWISVDLRMPELRKPVLVSVSVRHERGTISIAEYIEPKSVLADDYLDPEWSEEFGEYDEEKDCYWTPSGWFEWQIATEVNFYLTDAVTHWQLLPERAADA